jgi:hypothetical protein
MDVTDDSYGRANVHDVALAHKYLLCLFAYLAEEGRMQKLLTQKLLDNLIEVEGHGGIASRGDSDARHVVPCRQLQAAERADSKVLDGRARKSRTQIPELCNGRPFLRSLERWRSPVGLVRVQPDVFACLILHYKLRGSEYCCS